MRYHECDAQGVVFNANYFAYFDITFTEVWREAIGSYQASVEQRRRHGRRRGARPLPRAARASTTSSSCTGGSRRWGTPSMTARIDVVRDGETLVEGELRYVCVQAHTTSKMPIPDDIREALAPYTLSR